MILAWKLAAVSLVMLHSGSGYRTVHICAASNIGLDQSAAGPLIDIAVCNRHVRQYEIGEVKPFQLLAYDRSARVLVGANRLLAERFDGRNVPRPHSALKMTTAGPWPVSACRSACGHRA
ncbi:hypothetical protein E0H65_35655 [Rhizobium leguminosarum bv. viciae]|nr:hypothetical protein E0H65_35655 [Rhizobium leguminosarum bv. viciae]